MTPTIKGGLLAATIIGLSAGAASATSVRVTVENLLPDGSFSLTPFYVAFHDGSFDAFSSGEAASAGVELLAELGDVSGLPSERLAVDAESTARVIRSAGDGPPPLAPGASNSVVFDGENEVNTGNGERRFLTFLSMIVPTNDQFIGNGNPTAFEIFGADGAYLGDQSFDITAAFAYDAGTEVNSATDGPAFAVGVDATAGAEEGGVITQGLFGTDEFVGLDTPNGAVTQGLNLTSDLANTTIARISVAAVPVPATAPLLLAGIGGIAFLRRRRAAA